MRPGKRFGLSAIENSDIWCRWGTALLRNTIGDLLDHGKERVEVNLRAVEFVDSAGLGELVRTHVSIRSRRGQLKLVGPGLHVHDLLRITRLDRVFDIEPDEASALKSFKQGLASSRAAKVSSTIDGLN